MKKTCAGFLSLCLSILAALTPAAQAAQFSAQSAQIRAVALPSASLTPSLPALPTLGSSSLANPGLAPATLVPTGAEALESISQPRALSAEKAAALPGAQASAAAPSAQGALERAGRALSADGARSPEKTLDPLFENPGYRAQDCAGDCGSLTERADDAPFQALQPASVRPETAERAGSGVPQGPKSSFKRSLKVGFIGALLMLGIQGVASAAASVAHYHFHPGYQSPIPDGGLSLLGAIGALLGAAVFAPIAEEVIFRAGLMSAVKKLSTTLRMGSIVVPALVSSVIFAAVHEMRDPVLFAARVVGALVLARVYQKEGIAASIATHGFFNGSLFLVPAAISVVAMILGQGVGMIFGAALLPAAVVLAVRFHKQLKAEAPEREAGRIEPFQIEHKGALRLAAALLAASAFLLYALPGAREMAGLAQVWLAGSYGWLVYTATRQPFPPAKRTAFLLGTLLFGVLAALHSPLLLAAALGALTYAVLRVPAQVTRPRSAGAALLLMLALSITGMPAVLAAMVGWLIYAALRKPVRG